MPGSIRTEAVVLRSIRYGEADRVLHLYTVDRGRVGAIAKGVRRARSRFGGRLEPFFRIEALGRLFATDESHPAVYALLCNELALLDAHPERAGRANQLAFRLKLLLAAGLTPQLAHCASCGEREHLSGFSGAAGGVVCPACEASSFPMDEEAHTFLVEALGRPLTQAPVAEERALRQAERAIGETLEHHAQVCLRPAEA